MESYTSPVKVMNTTGLDAGWKWKCDFDLKTDDRKILSKNNNKLPSVTIKNNYTRPLKVHEKGNFRTRRYRSRIPAVREIVKEIDEKIAEELGPAPDVSPEPIRSGQVGSMTKLQYLEVKKNEFYANCFTKQMRLEGSIFMSKIKVMEKKLEARAQELYQDACAYNDFLKDTDVLGKKAKEHQTEETAKLEIAKDEFMTNQGKWLTVKKELVTMDEKLSTYYSSKSFLLLVFYNSKCLPRFLITAEKWKVFRKSPEYSPLFPREHLSGNSSNASRGSMTPKRSTTKHNSGSKSSSRVPSSRSLHKTKSNRTTTPTPVVTRNKTLAFLHEEFGTKVTFPEEWLKDTTFVDSESKKVMPFLNCEKWLLDIIHEFEEANLHYIMRFQNQRQKLERMKANYEKVSAKFNTDVDQLKKLTEIERKKVVELEQKANRLEFLSKYVSEGKHEKGLTMEEMFAKTTKQLKKIYHEIMGDTVDVDPIAMFSKIEFTCYDYFDKLEQLGVGFQKLMKIEAKKRRSREFKQKELAALVVLEEKMKQSRLRTAAEKKVFVGRKLMPRTLPPVKKSHKKDTKRQEEDLSYFFTE